MRSQGCLGKSPFSLGFDFLTREKKQFHEEEKLQSSQAVWCLEKHKFIQPSNRQS